MHWWGILRKWIWTGPSYSMTVLQLPGFEVVVPDPSKVYLGYAHLKHPVHSMWKIFKRSIIIPDSQYVQAVFMACHWDNNLIWQADWMLLKISDFSYLTAHARCSEDLCEESQEDCGTSMFCRWRSWKISQFYNWVVN